MYSWDTPDDANRDGRVSVVEMNAQLRQAQLDLLSAHCTTHRLRLRYSSDDLARFGRRDLLRESAEAASALSAYYATIEKRIYAPEPNPESTLEPSREKRCERSSGQPPNLTPELMAQAVECVSLYLRQQREHHALSARPLSNPYKAMMWPYFSSTLLDQIRLVELQGVRLPEPDFYAQAKALGFTNLPQIPHMESLTFLDVIVFNQRLTERGLFHALVHAVQFKILGLRRYTELFVRSFVNAKFHFSVPLEAHAFSLESRFASSSTDRFSVEDHIRRWVEQDRY